MAHRVLVVEDDTEFAERVASLLELHGHEVCTEHEGLSAIARFRHSPADIVITENVLPDTGSDSLISRLRALPGGSDVPVLLMSQVYSGGGLSVRELSALGVLAFLQKPFSLTELARTVARILGSADRGRVRVREELAVSGGGAGWSGAAPDLASIASSSDWSSEAPRTPGRSVGGATREIELPGSLRQSSVSLSGDGQVQAAAPSSLSRDMPAPRRSVPIKARSLAPVSYVQALARLFHDRSSGVLTLKTERTERRFFILNGYPVWLVVTPASDGCAGWLAEKERLSDYDLKRLLSKHERLGWSIPRILLAMDALPAAEMDKLLQAWIDEELMAGMNRSGSLEFVPTEDFADEIPIYEVNPIRSIWATVQASLRLGTAEVGLASIEGRFLRRRRTHDRLFGYMASTSVLVELRDWLASSRSYESIRDYFSGDWEEVARALWLLVHADLLAVSDEEEDSAVSFSGLASLETVAAPGGGEDETMRFDRDTVAALVAAVGGAEAVHDDLDDPEVRIIHDYVAKMEADHYAFLELSRDATDEELMAAYEALAPRYRPATLGPSIQGDSRRKAKELLSRLVKSFKVLSDPDARRAYDLGLGADATWETGTLELVDEDDDYYGEGEEEEGDPAGQRFELQIED